MKKEKIHYRPFMHVVRKSPFDLLMEHSGKVFEAITELSTMLKLYTEEKFDEAERIEPKISKLEDDADDIKRYIRERMPKGIFMPISREDIQSISKEQDAISDLAEDIAHLLAAYRTSVPEEIKEDLLRHNEVVVEGVAALKDAILHVSELLKRVFRKEDLEHILAHLHEIAKKEKEADELKAKLRRNLYALKDKLDFLSIYHLVRLVEMQDYIANHAENVEDRLRMIVAK